MALIGDSKGKILFSSIGRLLKQLNDMRQQHAVRAHMLPVVQLQIGILVKVIVLEAQFLIDV